MLGEQEYILPPLPKRGDVQAQYIQPIEQVLPKEALVDQGFQIAIRCCNNADIDRDYGIVADSHDLPLLYHPKQAALQVKTHLRYLIKEYGTGMGKLKQPHFSVLGSSGEGTPHIAEQLTFQERLRQCRAVDGNKGPA